MLLRLNKYSYLIIALSLFIVAAVVENGLLKKHPETHLIRDFQKNLLENEANLKTNMDQIVSMIAADNFDDNFNETMAGYHPLLESKAIGFLIYQAGTLKYWSDRSISFYNQIDEFDKTHGLLMLPNGYYLAETRNTGDFQIVGLHLIKNNYRYENKYLKNNFSDSYSLPDEFEIVEDAGDSAFPVFGGDGKYLFSLTPGGEYLCTKHQLYLPGIIYFFGLIVLLFYFRKEFVETKSPFFIKIFFLATALFMVYWLHIIFQIPKVFYHLDFFSPDYFALNNWLPSLGDYFILALFFFFWLYNFGSGLNIGQIHDDTKLSRKTIFVLLVLFNGILYLLVNFYIEKLINNSTLSFSLHKIIEISAQSALGIFSVGLFLLAVIHFTIKISDQSQNDFRLGQAALVIAAITIFLGMVSFFTAGRVPFAAVIFFGITSVLAFLFSKNYLQKFTLSYLIIYVSLTSFYSLVVFYSTTGLKEREHQKLFAVTLVTERDPAAEVFLAEIQKQISIDSEIPKLLIQNKEALQEYLKTTYFSSYFNKYLFDCYVCSGEDSLYIEMWGRMEDCFPFFEDMISSQGFQVPGTSFYFMDNMNGRISYTGKLYYPLTSESSGVSIYIELNSDILFEGIGFPELLIDKSMVKAENYKKFSYAKYSGGELTDKYGDYGYNFHVDGYLSSFENDRQVQDDEFVYNRWDGLEHLIYHTREGNYVIVSRKPFTVGDYLISFPYLFVFYFLSVLVLSFIGNPNMRKRPVSFNLKIRIQAAIISIVFISLLVVALVTIFYNIREYRERHRQDLNEKMKSISEEIDIRLEVVDEITVELEDWLHRELVKLSNIFQTDINIYGTDGNLIASSRFEIFERGLISTRINAQAYYEVYQNFQINYFQPEKIGQLSYLSAYRPILNYKGDYLGFINLPYFIKQDNYSQEISTFIVAFINLYVLLLLASIIVAVFISNQITRPLVLIQENLKKMGLGKRNEPILYNRKDEIGSLVKEYNKKVEELAVSAELLARSERESAWREMAKQIAHEIKNPLTPMKLNIQHLQRTKGEGAEYNKYIERVTATLIEQIDNLSNIATEFSNFAKLPAARNQIFNLTTQLQKVINLFETHDQAKMVFQPNGLEYIEVNADREQLSRAIINLIKNGIQSIPENHKGKIIIRLSRREHMAVIEVSDNGAGIPVELRDKLFGPSFTTKSSGMGLGLAIVKNIVENFSGKIWFETELGKGTSFFIEIPVYEPAQSD